MKFEASIIVAIRQGEKELFHGLILPYEETAYTLAFRVLRDNTDAEDVVQKACISAYRNLHSFCVESSFGSWLLSIVLNEAWIRLQEKKRSPSESVGQRQLSHLPPQSLS